MEIQNSILESEGLWNFLLELVRVYKSDLPLYVLILILLGGGIGFLYVYLKGRGVFRDPALLEVYNISTKLNLVHESIISNNVTVVENINQVIRNQNSKLTPDQVSIIVEITFEHVKVLLMKSAMIIYSTSELKDDVSIMEEMRDSFKATINKIDRELFKLPSIESAIATPEKKIQSLDEFDVYRKIYTVFKSSDKSQRDIANKIKPILDNIVEQYWHQM